MQTWRKILYAHQYSYTSLLLPIRIVVVITVIVYFMAFSAWIWVSLLLFSNSKTFWLRFGWNTTKFIRKQRQQEERTSKPQSNFHKTFTKLEIWTIVFRRSFKITKKHKKIGILGWYCLFYIKLYNPFLWSKIHMRFFSKKRSIDFHKSKSNFPCKILIHFNSTSQSMIMSKAHQLPNAQSSVSVIDFYGIIWILIRWLGELILKFL